MPKRSLLTVINDRSYFDRHRRHVAEAAGQAGWRSIVAMPAPESNNCEDYSDWRRVDFEPGRVAPWHDLKALLQLTKVLREEEPDLVHAITLKAVCIAGVALRLHRLRTRQTIPLVATFPGLGYTFMRGNKSIAQWVRSKLAAVGCEVVARWPSLWTTFETEHDRKVMIEAFGLSSKRSLVVQGTGLDLDAFSVDCAPSAEKLTVLFAGRLLRSKGVMAFVDAAVEPGAGRYRWLVAGWRYDSPDALSQPEMDALRHSERIEFLGAVSDMPSLLAKVHAVVLPSTYPEGIPRILIEAAATATPMITTDFAGARELVRPDETGFLIENSCGQDILNAVRRLEMLPDKGKAMGERARKLVEHGGFDSRSIQKHFLQVYEAALDGR